MIETPSRDARTPSAGAPPRAPRRRSLLHPFGRRPHKMTRAGLRNLARERSEALSELVSRRETLRPRDDIVLKDHEYPHRRVTLHDLETQRVYAAEHAEALADLREQFARRGIRNRTFDRHLQAPENGADLRTLSTALLEMAARLIR